MRVLVLGSGVIGTTSAYYLAQAGMQVTVVDRQPAAGMETSFANAGQVSPGYASPWAAPGVPLKALSWLFQRHSPLAIKATGDIDQYLWMAQMLRNCTASRYAVNKERMVRLSEYSRDCLDELRAETGIAYEGRTLGTTQLFRTQAQVDNAAKDIAVLERSGVPFELLDRAGIARVEPALAGVTDILAGALRLPNDQTGDCQMFTTRLAEMAVKLGSSFATTSPSNASTSLATGSTACGSTASWKPPIVTCWPWAVTRRNCSSHWASKRRCTRSKATR